MDTDSLSRNAYDAVIIEAEKFHHDLTLQFGVLSGICESENDYLISAKNMITDWIKNWDLNEVIEDIFYENPPNKKEFKRHLQRILQNIDNVRKIPIEKRKFDEF